LERREDMRKKVLVTIISFILFSLVANRCAFSWDDSITHKLLAEVSAKKSVLGTDYLQNLGFSDGLDNSIKWDGTEISVIKWIQKGADQEDRNWRPVNHFHNPLEPWSEAGLWGVNRLWESAVVWAQDSDKQAAWEKPVGVEQQYPQMPWAFPDTTPSTDWSWKMTRGYYFSALTAATDADRQENYAKMFRGLGHQMHLLQDMSVPAHVRNDSHLVQRWIEAWAADKIKTMDSLKIYMPNPQVPDISLMPSSSPDSAAPNPVANLFDTNLYIGANPDVTMPDPAQYIIGLSEYTNANFVSTYTIEDSSLPYPNVSDDSRELSVSRMTIDIPDPRLPKNSNVYVKRDYFWKERHGDSGYLLAGVGAPQLFADSNQMPWNPSATLYAMDNLVHEGYVARLLPRAVGYSAGLLNYFFRGDIEITLPDEGVYGLIDNTATSADPNFKDIRLKARNTTATGEETSNGTIQLVVKYKKAESDPFHSGTVPSYGPANIEYDQPGRDSDFYYIVVSASDPSIISIPSDTQGVELTFNLPEPLPLWATDVSLQVVYKGQLGNEANAVAVGFNDISEPTPIGIANDMDYVCINEAWHEAGSQDALDLVDSNPHNGSVDFAEGDIYPHSAEKFFLKFSPESKPVSASTTTYTVQLSGLTLPPGYVKSQAVFILADPYIAMSLFYTNTNTSTADLFSTFYEVPKIYDVFTVQQQDDWELPEYWEHRGSKIYEICGLINQAIKSKVSCQENALDGIAPALQPIQ